MRRSVTAGTTLAALALLGVFAASCEARRCQDSVQVLPYAPDVVCDPTATATLTTTTDGRTVVVCTCPKEGAAEAPVTRGPDVTLGLTAEDD